MSERRDFLSLCGVAAAGVILPKKSLASAWSASCESEWQRVTDGLWVKYLWKQGHGAASLYRLESDFEFAHSHPAGEFNFFIRGEICIDDVWYRPGQNLYMHPGSCHSGHAGANGCEVLVVLPQPIIPLEKCEKSV